MATRSANARQSRFDDLRDESYDSSNPFHTDQQSVTFEHVRLQEWHGAALSVGSYEPTRATHLKSKNACDVVLIVLQGTVYDHEGEIDGNGFRFGEARRGDASIFPLASALDFNVASSRMRNCELYFPENFGSTQLGLRDERPFKLQLARSDPFLFHAAEQFVALQNRDDDIAALLKDSLFRTLALHLFACYREGSAVHSQLLSRRLTALRARELQCYVDDELHRRLNRDELARRSGCDVREFSSVFRNTFGVTPAQYVIDRRLDRASQLIRDTALDLADIALRTGFSSQSHLTTALRKRRGVTPFQLRRHSTRVFVIERRREDLDAR